ALVPASSPSRIQVRSARGEELFRSTVKKLVNNPEQVPGKACEKILSSFQERNDIVEYLIITDPEFETQFQVLADWKMKKGFPSEVVTTSWVYSNYGGALDDDATRVRECIRDYWQNKGLLYVLLGGDTHYTTTPKVPDRRAFAQTEEEGADIPCDLYFADLDGGWDDDGDGIYGEYPDDGIDMYADLYAGRATVATTDEATLFVNKVLQYEGESSLPLIDPATRTKMFFMASILDVDADAKEVKQAIDAESVPSQFDPITELYHSDGNLSPTTAKAAIEEGQNLINHIGHGNGTSMQAGDNYLKNSGFYTLTNAPNYAIIYTVSCYTGNFVSADCIGEKFVLAPDGGGFFVGSSRYSWYSTPDFDNTLSNRYDREFFKALLQPQYNYYPLGQVNQEAKHKRVNAAKNDSIERYIMYSVNLLGDPETPVWKNTPKTFNVTHFKALDLSGSPLEVRVKSGSSPVEGAVVCLWKADEVYLVDVTNAAGEVTFTPAPATVGSMFITITKPDHQPYEGTIAVLDSLLAADGTSISAATGGAINFTLTAGPGYGSRAYFMLGTSSGTSPGTGLPGGLSTLPLNWDLVTDLILQLVNSPIFLNFAGTLDSSGQAAAQFNTYGPLPSSYIGLNLHFAYMFYNPFDMASNAVPVEILP
ncbi:MAG: C25 family cysteine peptidase, partial [Planctomycetota bacterium]